MSKKAMAAFTLAVAGAAAAPSIASAYAEQANNTSSTWQLPAVSSITQQGTAVSGGDYSVTVEQRSSTDSPWVNVTKTQGQDSTDSDAQRKDAVFQAQKLIGDPQIVDAKTTDDALLRVTYKEDKAPNKYQSNTQSITFYEGAQGWMQNSSDKHDKIKFTAATQTSDDEGNITNENAKVQFVDAPEQNSTAASSTAKAQASTPSSTSTKATPSVSAKSKPASSSKVTAKSSTKAPASKAPSEGAKSTASNEASIALPITGMKAAATNNPTISGTVFVDSNRNGSFDSNDQPAGNRIVQLKDTSDHSLLQTTTTDSQGRYSFTGLDLKSYEVDVQTNASGSKVTSVWGNTGKTSAVATLSSDTPQTTVDFGVSTGNTQGGVTSPDSSTSSSTPSSSATPTPSTSSTPTQSSTPSSSSNNSSTQSARNGINSGEIPNSTNTAALAAGVGSFGLAGLFARKGMRKNQR